MRNRKSILILILALIVCAAAVPVALRMPGKGNARRRLDAFVRQVNDGYHSPGKIYGYLTEEYRNSISEADFIEAFQKERSYPYLTPFYINFMSMDMAPDNKSGVAHFSQAARLGGMYYDIPIIYENFNYYMVMKEYEGFPDGSYLEKFDRIPSYLINGWDLD